MCRLRTLLSVITFACLPSVSARAVNLVPLSLDPVSVTIEVFAGSGGALLTSPVATGSAFLDGTLDAPFTETDIRAQAVIVGNSLIFSASGTSTAQNAPAIPTAVTFGVRAVFDVHLPTLDGTTQSLFIPLQRLSRNSYTQHYRTSYRVLLPFRGLLPSQ